jgi:hypothetical protein
MKSVCIIGAGPAGLVAAKTFLQTGQFTVTVYEKSNRLGGIWALEQNSTGGFLSPNTPTNLSRFTVAFSDLDWNFVDLDDGGRDGQETAGRPGRKAPIFPKAWQVNRYLEEYARRYIPIGVITYEREVVETNIFRQLAIGSPERWRVTTKDQHGTLEKQEFDHLVIATGFFASPRPLRHNVAVDNELPGIKIMHSSAFRNLRNLFPNERNAAGKRILLIGGGNSAGEAAAAVASQLSNSQWSPDTSMQKRFERCKVIHVTPNPIYALTPYIPSHADATTFMPVDFNLYNLAKRPPGPIDGSAGRVPDGVKEMIHGALQNMIGGDQSDLGAAALVTPVTGRKTVQVALSEIYSEYVRSGLIEVVAGRVTAIQCGEVYSASVTVKQGDIDNKLDNIGAVIYATGYTPEPALQMLHASDKKALDHDAESPRLPLILEQWQTKGKHSDKRAFIGFYEGPYWGVMEMQARLTLKRWLDQVDVPSKVYEDREKMQDLRKAMRDRELDVPQYWLGDCNFVRPSLVMNVTNVITDAGYMEELARELSLQRNDGPFEIREGPVSPSRYLSENDNKHEADAIIRDLHSTWHDCSQNGKFVARAAFRALQGDWTIHRRIDSKRGGFPSGTLSGTASFHPRAPTPDRSGQIFDFEYLYIESGTFTFATGQSMTASRRYVYRYAEAEDKLSVWFVKPERNLEVDYLFHNLHFVPPKEAEGEGACVAKADHLCVEDMYWTDYRLPLKGIALHTFETTHKVKGPSKDYVSRTEYRRPQKD